ncbi:unnamed protein product [Symbiodinium natans]|uniref:Uncharacterized protein n=1 Tax=Symbiodinium natans TaxID=878477 RepID=A0A812SNP3_9DINO|nr:unnamed protein product [Symbiodinium natans]
MIDFDTAGTPWGWRRSFALNALAVKQENPEFDRSSSAEEAAEDEPGQDQEASNLRAEAERRCREELQERLKAEEEELKRRQTLPERTPVVVPARIQVPTLRLSDVERRARAELQARLKAEERQIAEERLQARPAVRCGTVKRNSAVGAN